MFDDNSKLIYCPIPKVACSSLKLWLLQNSGFQNQIGLQEIHEHTSRHNSLRVLSSAQARQRLSDPSYLKFVFFRCPYSRLVSAFMDKFCSADKRIIDITWQVQNGDSVMAPFMNRLPRHAKRNICRWFSPDLDQGISFREFVEYLGDQDLAKVDPHWRLQSSFIGETKFDFVGKFETLEQDVDRLCQLQGISTRLAHRNRTLTKMPVEPICDYSEWNVNQLNELDAMPGAASFYNETLRKTVYRLYRSDFELIENVE